MHSIFLPVILVNFLIAKMSNKYTELEENEEITSYKEKAELIAEIEYFYLIKNKRNNQKKDDFKKFAFIVKNTANDV